MLANGNEPAEVAFARDQTERVRRNLEKLHADAAQVTALFAPDFRTV
jgi:hypothetical protein